METNIDQDEKHCGKLNEFFWICSGANRTILRQYPNDYSKYFGIGGTIFFTAVMAMLSGGYALYTVFKDPTLDINVTDYGALWKGILFGIFWGLLIFNLDRFMVNTMYTDGKYTISGLELKSGLPRIVLAVFLGIVISTPIELRIFEDRIETQLKVDAGLDSKKIDAANQNLLNSITTKQNEIAGYEKQKLQINDKIKQAQQDVDDEINGSQGSKTKGIGLRARQKMEELKQLQSERDIQFSQLNSSIKNAQTQLNQLNNDNGEYAKTRNQAVNASKGLSARLKALSEVTSSGTLLVARVLIMFLFIAIEIIPTIFKMMVCFGPYDYRLMSENDHEKAQSLLQQSRNNDKANTDAEIAAQNNINRKQIEEKEYTTFQEKIATAQAELTDIAIKMWKEEELKKINNNPLKYLKQIKDNTSDNSSDL